MTRSTQVTRVLFLSSGVTDLTPSAVLPMPSASQVHRPEHEDRDRVEAHFSGRPVDFDAMRVPLELEV